MKTTTSIEDFDLNAFEMPHNGTHAEEEPERLIPDHLKEIPSRQIFGLKGRVREKITYIITHDDGVPIAKRNAMTLIKGREGSRKSFLSSCINMSRFTRDKDLTLLFRMNLKDNEIILHFDTEMDLEETEERKEFFNEYTGISPDDERYRVYNIRDYTPMQRIEIISEVLRQIDEEGGAVAVLLIDQIADLLPSGDVNDISEGNMVYSHFLGWMRNYNCSLMPVMHTNRGGTETDGRVGKLMDKKAFTSLLVTYDHDNGETTVLQHKGRKRKLKKFRFMQDSVGRPKFLHDDSDLFI